MSLYMARDSRLVARGSGYRDEARGLGLVARGSGARGLCGSGGSRLVAQNIGDCYGWNVNNVILVYTQWNNIKQFVGL